MKSFTKEILNDAFENPVQYSTSLFTGMFTYFNISPDTSNLVATELIKSAFSIFNALFIFLLVFIAKKIAEPLWEQKLKGRVNKWFKLKKEK